MLKVLPRMLTRFLQRLGKLRSWQEALPRSGQNGGQSLHSRARQKPLVCGQVRLHSINFNFRCQFLEYGGHGFGKSYTE